MEGVNHFIFSHRYFYAIHAMAIYSIDFIRILDKKQQVSVSAGLTYVKKLTAK